MATINLRTDEKLKKEANKVFSEFGLDMSNAVKLFLHQVVITKSIPFPIKTINGFTMEEEKRMLKEKNKLIKDIKSRKVKPFNSVKELMEDLLS